MHILIVSDLHHRRDWYRWLASQKVDLTVIAGDLMDGFDSKGGAAQMLYIDDWCRNFAGSLALCSGNHDANGIEVRNPDAVKRLPLATQEQIARIIRHEQKSEITGKYYWSNGFLGPQGTEGRSLGLYARCFLQKFLHASLCVNAVIWELDY